MSKPNGLSLIASAFADAYKGAMETGGLMDSVIATVKSVYRGKAVPEQDAKFIADEVARQRHWVGSSAEPRKSEVRTVLAQYVMLPEAIALARANKSGKPLAFSNVVRIARGLNKGKTPAIAARDAMKATKRAKPAGERTLEEAIASAATHVKRILEHVALPRKFRAGLIALCDEYAIPSA